MTNVLIWWKVLIIGEAKHVGGGVEDIWEISVPSIQLCYRLKTALKIYL